MVQLYASTILLGAAKNGKGAFKYGEHIGGEKSG